MAINDKRLDQLPSTENVFPADLFHVSQGGIDKRINATDLADSISGGNPFKLSIVEVTSTSRTLTTNDVLSYMRFLNDDPAVINIPTVEDAGWVLGDNIIFRKEGDGNISLNVMPGVTVNSLPDDLELTLRGQQAQLIYVRPNEWDFIAGFGAEPSEVGDSLGSLATPSQSSYIRTNTDGTAENRNFTQVKEDLELDNVDNTSDLDKPISDATQSALDDKYTAGDLIDWNLSVEGSVTIDGNLSVNGNQLIAVQNNLEATSPPTAGDDSSEGYSVLSKWVDQSEDEIYICTDATPGAAVWKNNTLEVGDLSNLAVTNATTAGLALVQQPTPGSDSYIRLNSDGTTTNRTATQVRDDIGVQYGISTGTVTEGNDARLSDAREWSADTVTQTEAEGGTATTRRAWTAQRVRQAITAWFQGVSGALGRTILSRTTPAQVRNDIELGAFTSGPQRADISAGSDSVVKDNWTVQRGTLGGGFLRGHVGGTEWESSKDVHSYLMIARKRLAGDQVEGNGFTGTVFYSRGGTTQTHRNDVVDINVSAGYTTNYTTPPVVRSTASDQIFRLVEVIYNEEIWYALERSSSAESYVSVVGICRGPQEPFVVHDYDVSDVVLVHESVTPYTSGNVSADINTMLESANNAAIRSNIGVTKVNTLEISSSRTISLTEDDNRMFEVTGSSAKTITIPSGTPPEGEFSFHIRNHGTGMVTIAGASGVTVIPPKGGTLTIDQHATASATKSKVGTDTWIVYGQVESA